LISLLGVGFLFGWVQIRAKPKGSPSHKKFPCPARLLLLPWLAAGHKQKSHVKGKNFFTESVIIGREIDMD